MDIHHGQLRDKSHYVVWGFLIDKRLLIFLFVAKQSYKLLRANNQIVILLKISRLFVLLMPFNAKKLWAIFHKKLKKQGISSIKSLQLASMFAGAILKPGVGAGLAQWQICKP